MSVRLETGPKDRHHKSTKENTDIGGGVPTEHVQCALKFFAMDMSLFDVSVMIEQRQS